MSLNLNVMMNAKVLKGLEEMFQENTVTTIRMLAVKYGFSEEEALVFMNVGEEVKIVKTKTKTKTKEKEEKEVKEKKVKEKKEKKEGPKVVLPYCGRVVEEWCEGVKLNHGLYSQCVSEKSVSETSVGEEKYCKSCKKQAETNESGKPSLGDIRERLLKSSAEYRAEKGKKSVVYAVVMKKLKISKAEAVAEALKFGLVIPEEEFELPKAQRGRPKKVSESESETSGSGEGEKKRRGRPKKNKTVAENESDETDDLIASLVAEANALKSGSAEASETEASEEEEESENSVLLQEIVAKINADETYNKLNSMVVSKKERKKHLNAIGEHIKTLLTEEEMALYTGAPEEAEACEEAEEAGEAEEVEAEAGEEACEAEEVEDEATRKAREAAEKKAQLEAEKLKKKEQADLEKKQKKEQADLEKKAKAEADKKAKAEAAAEKKAQLEAEKLKKKEQADLEKKQKKEQADLEKKAKAEADKKAKAEAAAEKKAGEAEAGEAEAGKKKPAEVTPVEKKTTAELQDEPVEEAGASVAGASEAGASVAGASEAGASVAEASQTVNAKVFEFQGKKYLKTEEGILYDQETEECVGVWNEETKSIDDFADDDE